MQVLERPGNLLTLVIKFSLKTIVYSIILDFYFVRVSCFNYCAFGRPGKIYLSPGKVLETVSEKEYKPCKKVLLKIERQSSEF